MSSENARKVWRFVRELLSLLMGVYAVGLFLFVVVRLLVGDSLWWVGFFANVMPVYFIAFIVLLPLGILLRARRSVLLMLPMALLGALWFSPLYFPRTHAVPPASDTTLRVVSMNVWGDNPDLTRIQEWLNQQKADVVVTVELPPAWNAGIPALADSYPHQVTHTEWTRYWGSTLLTSHPIVSQETFTLVPDSIPQQRIVIDVGGQQIAVYGIHLDLPLENANIPAIRTNNIYVEMFLHYNEISRDASIRTLLARLKNDPLPYIVAGDFNTSDQSLIYNDLASALGDSFREAGTGLGTSWPMLNATLKLPLLVPPLMRIDYIWHSSQFQVVAASEGPFLGSDHLPMLATLALK
ncbi:MAG: endonuclease/exonuclease/phosphatase family protein [Chloroflexota bacterium]